MAQRELILPLETPLGKILIHWSKGKLARLVLAELNPSGRLHFTTPPVDDANLAELIDVLRAYFSGEVVRFSVPLNLSGQTDFCKSVWRVVSTVPYGETRTYGWVAAQLGKFGAARAVGGALAQNPFPIVIPCHRVLRADGSLGGFSAGLEWKKALLGLEGAALKGQNASAF